MYRPHHPPLRIAFVSDSRNRRIQRVGDRDLQRAVEWVDRNRGRFRCAVYGPLVAEVGQQTDMLLSSLLCRLSARIILCCGHFGAVKEH